AGFPTNATGTATMLAKGGLVRVNPAPQVKGSGIIAALAHPPHYAVPISKVPAPKEWAQAILQGLGFTLRPQSIKNLVHWQAQEAKHQKADFNPLNTEMPIPGSTAGHTGFTGQIREYKT